MSDADRTPPPLSDEELALIGKAVRRAALTELRQRVYAHGHAGETLVAELEILGFTIARKP